VLAHALEVSRTPKRHAGVTCGLLEIISNPPTQALLPPVLVQHFTDAAPSGCLPPPVPSGNQEPHWKRMPPIPP
jgi:hypothetical protein